MEQVPPVKTCSSRHRQATAVPCSPAATRSRCFTSPAPAGSAATPRLHKGVGRAGQGRAGGHVLQVRVGSQGWLASAACPPHCAATCTDVVHTLQQAQLASLKTQGCCCQASRQHPWRAQYCSPVESIVLLIKRVGGQVGVLHMPRAVVAHAWQFVGRGSGSGGIGLAHWQGGMAMAEQRKQRG